MSVVICVGETRVQGDKTEYLEAWGITPMPTREEVDPFRERTIRVRHGFFTWEQERRNPSRQFYKVRIQRGDRLKRISRVSTATQLCF